MSEAYAPTAETIESGITGPTITPAYLVSGGVGGRWTINTTGPAAALWQDSGVGSRLEIDSASVVDDSTLFAAVGSRIFVK